MKTFFIALLLCCFFSQQLLANEADDGFDIYNHETSCIPYYKKRIEVIRSKLTLGGIIAPASSILVGVGSAVGGITAGAFSLPGVVLAEEVIRLQTELVHRTYVLEMLKAAYRISTPDHPSIDDLTINSINFFIKIFKKYPRLEQNVDQSAVIISKKLVEADKAKIFCDGQLKRKGYDSYDFHFRKNLATKKEFLEFTRKLIEKEMLGNI